MLHTYQSLLAHLKTDVDPLKAAGDASLLLPPDDSTQRRHQQEKYIQAVLEAKASIEFCLASSAVLAPVHDLSRHILIVNAFYREAEHTHNPYKVTLLDTLTELSSIHSSLLHRSIFGLPVLTTTTATGPRTAAWSQRSVARVRATAAELLRLQPAFARRLHQREFDLVFTRPVKRRLLLKMYMVSIFMRCLKKTQTRPEEERRLKIVETTKPSVGEDRETKALRPVQLKDPYVSLLYNKQEDTLVDFAGKAIRHNLHRMFEAPQDMVELAPIPHHLLQRVNPSGTTRLASKSKDKRLSGPSKDLDTDQYLMDPQQDDLIFSTPNIEHGEADNSVDNQIEPTHASHSQKDNRTNESIA